MDFHTPPRGKVVVIIRKSHVERRIREYVAKVGSKWKHEIVDLDTGEIIHEWWETHSRQSPTEKQKFVKDGTNNKVVGFYKVYYDNWSDIIDKKQLSFQEIGVLMSLMRFINWESNYLVHPKTGENLNLSELAKLLKTSRSDLSQYVDRLHNKGLLAKVSTGGPGFPNHYILNSNILFRGNKIKDISEHICFTKDCEYTPAKDITYKERE